MGQIVITGFMATGKSEVGRRLAAALGRPFVDIDALVEAAAGRPIHTIFATAGEATFRALERAAVERAAGVPEAVVATGGGTLLDPENCGRLAAGTLICLTAAPEVILKRVGDPASRPLLAGGNGGGVLARIRGLLAERAATYATAAHTVDTTRLTIDQVVERVQALVVSGA